MLKIKSNRRKDKLRFSRFHMLVMVIVLTIMTAASISAFEWLQRGIKSQIFVLRGITVEGNLRVSSEDIVRASTLRIGTDSVYSTKTYILEKHIKSRFSYIGEVDVQRRMNGWMNISVGERTPLACAADCRDADSFAVIDEHGFILEEVSANEHNLGIPVVVGIDNGEHRDRATKADDAREIPFQPGSFALALDVLNTARSVVPGLFDEMSLLDVRDPDNIRIHLQKQKVNDEKYIDQSPLILIASDGIEEGLSNALTVIEKRREENKETKYIDARLPGEIYCGSETRFEGGWKSG